MNKKLFTCIALWCLTQQFLSAQSIRSVLMNPPGTDDGLEYFEIQGTAGASLTNLYFIAIEGDGTGAGAVDLVLSLGSLSLGSNGLLLWRDAATVISPAPSAETTVNVSNFTDIENGSNTFMLVQATTAPTVGTDYDTNNDGTLDVTLPFTVISAVSVIENDGANNYGYADEVGGTVLGPFVGYNPDFLAFDGTQWVAGDILGSGSGPYSVDPTRNNISGTYSAILTPGNGTSPLPVSFLYFWAKVLDGVVQLEFATEREENNAYFDIERSNDGISFAVIGQLSGAGTNNTPSKYQYTDEQPLVGRSFYRLRQVDTDNKDTYSPLRSVELAQPDFSVFPQPVADVLQVVPGIKMPTETNWFLCDVNGSVIATGNIPEEQQTPVTIQMGAVPPGVYILTFKNDRVAFSSQKIVKQ